MANVVVVKPSTNVVKVVRQATSVVVSTKGLPGDPGIVVSQTAPASPYLNQLWLSIP